MPSLPVHQYSDAQSVLDAIERQFTITDENLIEITKGFIDEFELGLNNYGKDMAMMRVFFPRQYPLKVLTEFYSPTFVTGVPDGTEKGLVTSEM